MRTMGIVFCLLTAISAFAQSDLPAPQFYRDLTLKIRTDGQFRIYMPDGRNQDVRYHFQAGKPIYENPMISDMHFRGNGNGVFRSFWDRILVTDDSYIEVGGERVPMTCLVVSGDDNRFSGSDSPLIPGLRMRIYFVANDFSCQGPIRKGWPESGGRKEAWDTYLYYEILDPTIMLPQDTLLRLRWNEYNAVLIDGGP